MILITIYSTQEKVIEQIDLSMIDNSVREEIRKQSEILFKKVLDFK